MMESPLHHVLISSSSSAGIATLSQSHSKHQPVLAKKSAPASVTSPLSNITSLPATVSSSSSSSSSGSPELLRCKRRINFGGLGYALPQAQPATVARRNERERNRVKMVNLGFATLRQHVPNGAKNKKMSKVETLKSAVEYIRQLQQLLGDNDDVSCPNGQFSNSQRQSTSSDENWNPSSLSTLSPTTNSQSPVSLGYPCTVPTNSGMMMRASPSCSPISPMVANSPSPSIGSDASSPYDSLDSIERVVSPEEEDLFDFSNWFS